MREPGKRCALGDLAILVRSNWPENRGRLVRVIARSDWHPFDWEVHSQGTPFRGFVRDVPAIATHMTLCVGDWQLQPLQPLEETPVEALLALGQAVLARKAGAA